MNNLTRLMFKLVNNVVFEKPINKEDFQNLTDKDYINLFKISKRHDIAHIVGQSLEENKLINKENIVYSYFHNEILTAVFRSEWVDYELNAICQAFEKAEIPFIPLKGVIIKKYYKATWMRTSCDIDILVKNEDLTKAINTLESQLSFTAGDMHTHDITLFSPNDVHLELHFQLIEENVAKHSYNVLYNVWNDVKPIKNSNYHLAMTNEMFYFYHIAHMAKHFVNGGCGLRPFIDIAVMQKAMKIDMQKFKQLLIKGNLLEFYDASIKIVNHLFYDGKSDELIDRMENYITFGGIYGKRENTLKVNQIKKGGKFKYIWSRIFMPYKSLKLKYPILEKHKYLTPFYEIRRWFSLLFCPERFKKSINELNTTSNFEKEELLKTEEMLKKLKLL